MIEPTKLLAIIERHGFGIFVAIVLLAELLGFNPYSPSKQITREHQELRWILRQICVNTAKTETEYRGCFVDSGPVRTRRAFDDVRILR